MRILLMTMFSGILLLMMQITVFAGLDREEQAKVDALAETLHLNAEQKASVVKEREKSKQRLLSLEKEWQQLHDHLRQEVRSDTPNQAKVDELAGSIGKIRGEIISLRTKSLIHLKSILTPEQIRILEKARDKGGEETEPHK